MTGPATSDLDITRPPAKVDYSGFVAGDWVTLTMTIPLVTPSDPAVQMQLVIKNNPLDDDTAPTTKRVTIAALSSSGGVFTQTEGIVTARFRMRPSLTSTITAQRTYGVRLWSQHGAETPFDTVQIGTLTPNPAASTQDGAIVAGIGEPSSVALFSAQAVFLAGTTFQVFAEALEEDGSIIPDVTFTYASRDESIATVDDTGLVTTLARGVVVISATGRSVAGTRAFHVSVIRTTSDGTTRITSQGGIRITS